MGRQVAPKINDQSDRLTSYLERGMATNGLADSVLGHAPVLAAVLLLLALHGAVEE